MSGILFSNGMDDGRMATMPVTSEIDTDFRFILTTCSGLVRLDDILEHDASLEKRLEAGSRWRRLIDMRPLELYAVTTTDESRLAHSAAQAFEPMGIVKTAVVAEYDLVYGLTRLFETHLGSDHDSFRVFRNMAQARQWLGVDDAPSDRALG